ncbi:unnamed protein product [Phaedon cochleariae]|uniref:Uncharacterized protein n=1 Tax=Phaedon cochleariae TaxID=80249 RepID=A0A9N9X319_PHACE|nr:unnamed protein product [Phaedon cochleariae]
MECGRLSKSELVYELKIRGLEDVGTMEEMRSTLRRLVRMEKDGESLKYPEYQLVADDELKICEVKLDDLGKLLSDLTTDERSSPFKKIETKLQHTLMRVDRIPTTTEEEKKKRSKLLAKLLQLKTQLLQRDKVVNSLQRNVNLQGVTPAQTSDPEEATVVGMSRDGGMSEWNKRIPVFDDERGTHPVEFVKGICVRSFCVPCGRLVDNSADGKESRRPTTFVSPPAILGSVSPLFGIDLPSCFVRAHVIKKSSATCQRKLKH